MNKERILEIFDEAAREEKDNRGWDGRIVFWRELVVRVRNEFKRLLSQELGELPEKPQSLEELAEAQGVQPIQDISALAGTWPGEMEDGFEESILNLRKKGG